jgi:glutathione synthase/RimK-type ligase-like ATP-grasp enzyme
MSQEPSRDRWFSSAAADRPLVLIATERLLPEADPDEELLLEALAGVGLGVRLAAWDDPAVEWAAASLAVIRSTWDYHHQREAFLAWADRTGAQTRLWNSAPVLRWNSHKAYLLDLAKAGVPVVPTLLLRRGSDALLADVMSGRGWERVVVKPAVSASSYRTLDVRPENSEDGEEHLRAVLAERDALVQPYVPSVEDCGERAVIWIDGAFTHAVRKSPRFAHDEEAVSEALPIERDELAVAESALAVVKEPIMYGRVDMARDASGQPMVMEMELIEPSLYLLQHRPALDRLVRAVVGRLDTR